jgi:hypothetical protein
MTRVAALVALLPQPVTTAIASTVFVADTVNGPVYCVDEVDGIEPFVV